MVEAREFASKVGWAMAEPWYSAFETAWRWGSFILAHALVAMLLLAVVAIIQRLVLLLGDPKIFDVIPLRYVFDGMDLAILVAFVVLGTVEAVVVFRGKP